MDFAGKDKSEYVKETFNAIAGKYDLMNSLMSMGMDNAWRAKAVRIVEAKPGMKMIDLCCGTGKLTREIAVAVGDSGRVIGVDFSEEMLAVGGKNIENDRYKASIELLQGNAMSLPFTDNSFDGATVGWGLRNLPDLRRGIREMIRVVKPGSMVVSLDMGKPTMPVFKQLYWLYFEKIVPWLGKIHGGKQKEYTYLFDSACEFESQRQLAQIFAECGLQDTGYKNLVGGVVAIVYGRKSK
ncbi:Ubiquinone [Dehalobacter sp. UNSWDHB]|jgi:ubiquinone/menaquinone biosynthesis methyltransferases|uniref:demethylmenaquinone methyltransferase n=1 Tax=unclassified Dehalobacter TaxID=2635733 RepID=UPI00028AB1AD|nr:MULTISPECIES: demethylmenaquinone methyltransferase [unclassified Dehalobacter]AFV01383.1 Ubiquinone/menaquinone biosynthesis methyltransferase UbiE [Dehalobacter sp. DCA]AFV04421.1 Ubiquinone/menaquinone biosynthesis methyltransferase UbiE [Dehalobacter sp. CF]EQB21337.1 Ubiquinone [Dehalobacter sp. UNSWDHB]